MQRRNREVRVGASLSRSVVSSRSLCGASQITSVVAELLQEPREIGLAEDHSNFNHLWSGQIGTGETAHFGRSDVTKFMELLERLRWHRRRCPIRASVPYAEQNCIFEVFELEIR